MDWDDLKILLAIARAGSISAAAKQLGVSHSTVYRRVRSFEESHHVNLFERNADGYRLVDGTDDVIALVERVESAVDDVARKLRSQGSAVQGSVSIAAPEAAALLVCPRLAPLLETFPHLCLSWKLDADSGSLIRREADIAIVAAASPPPALFGRRLVDIDFAVYGSRHYLERNGIEDASEARWIVFDDTLASLPVPRWEKQHVPADRVAMRVNRRVMLDDAVLAGVGVGVMPRLTGDAQPQLMRLANPVNVTLPLWVLTHPDLRAAPAVSAVFDAVVEILGDEHQRLQVGESEE